MQKINFEDLPSTATPINATNLNAIQTNAEDAINGIVESGSWTPTIASLAGDGDPTVEYIARRGKYKKINNIVFVEFYIRAKITALNGTNNYARITGLPYSAENLGFGAKTLNIGALYSAIYDPTDSKFVILDNTIRIQQNYGSGAAKWIVTPTDYMEVAGSGFYFIQ